VTFGRTPLGLVAAAQLHGSGALAPHSIGLGDSRPMVVVFDRGFEAPRVQQASAGLEWEWMPRTSLTLTFLHATGDHLPRALERNVSPPGPFAGVSRLVAIESTDQSTYNGMSVEFRRDLWQGIHYRLAYIVGRATDTGSVDVLLPGGREDRFIRPAGDPDLDRRAPADNDQRHRFVGSAIYFSESFAGRRGRVLRTLLDDWRISATYVLQGGLPYTAYAAGDLNGDRNVFNDIAPGTTRNGFRREKEGRLNARLAREFAFPNLTVTPSLDLFNVFNAAHYRHIDDTLYAGSGATLIENPRFGRRFSPEPGRIAQLGLAIAF
jgi:hypothetical protein